METVVEREQREEREREAALLQERQRSVDAAQDIARTRRLERIAWQAPYEQLLQGLLNEIKPQLRRQEAVPRKQWSYRDRCDYETLVDLQEAIVHGAAHAHGLQTLGAEFSRRGWPIPQRGLVGLNTVRRMLKESRAELAELDKW